MKIGFVIGRVGGLDGVALETEKWVAVFRRMGHETAILTGQVESLTEGTTVMPELAFDHPACVQSQEEAFFGQPVEEMELVWRLGRDASRMAKRIRKWLEHERLDLLVTQNATSLPCHLTMGMALRGVLEETRLPAIGHDHDFAWERGGRYDTPYHSVREILARCFPPDLPNLRHVVLSTHARDVLARRKGIASTVVPNVMDFEGSFGRKDPVARTLPGALGLAEGDLLLFQVTRIVRRKGIERAIDLVLRLGDPRVRLVVTGTAKDDHGEEYFRSLKRRVLSLGLEDRVLFAGGRFARVRGTDRHGQRVYSLSDAYAAATACTYFSSYEGFGNAFVEAIAARRPIFVNNYEPVYWPDIGSRGFRTVRIEGGRLTAGAVESVRRILDDPGERREVAEHNFELGRRHFSYEVLERRLGDLLVTPVPVSSGG